MLVAVAATLAFAGHKVILVEADLRRPSIGEALDLQARPGKRGTAGVLMGEILLKDATIPATSVSENLQVLLVERSAANLADGLLASSDDLSPEAVVAGRYLLDRYTKRERKARVAVDARVRKLKKKSTLAFD